MVAGRFRRLLGISTYLICKVLLLYVDILNRLIFDAVYDSWILSLPLFTLVIINIFASIYVQFTEAPKY